MRSSRVCGRDLAEWLERLAVNVKVTTVLGVKSQHPPDVVESEGRQIKQC
jgi:hypothetical protein